MKGRILVIGAACAAAAVVAALAQSDVNPAADPAAAPAADPAAAAAQEPAAAAAQEPAASDQPKPASVETPTSDAEATEAGQPLAPPVPGETPQPGAEETMQPEPVAPAEEAVIADEAIPPEEPRRKLWRVIPIFSAGVLYDDNIFLTNTNRIADVIWTISGGLALELGDFRSETENYLTALWVGIPVFYTDNPEENSFNQKATLAVQYRWSKLVGKFESNYSIERAGNREVNTITTNQTFSNRLRFIYDYSEKTSFDLQFSQLFTSVDSPSGAQPRSLPLAVDSSSVDSVESNSQYEAKAGMNYQMFPKTKIGFEGAGGIVDQASSPLQYYQQIRLRINYVATGKLNFKFSGGVEARQFEGRDNIKISPVFSLGLEYRPFDGTGLSVIGYRNISAASSLTGQDVTATGFEIAATQRFLQKFIAGISFGYENDVYFPTSGETPAGTDRVDNYLFVRSKLSYSLVRWASVNVFYEYRRTVSTQTTSSFYGNRIGMEIAAQF